MNENTIAWTAWTAAILAVVAPMTIPAPYGILTSAAALAVTIAVAIRYNITK